MIRKFAVSSYWRDIVLQASGNSIAQFIGVIGIPLLSRLYTPADFAVQNIFLQLVMFLAGVMTWRYEYFFQMLKSQGQASLLLGSIVRIGGLAGFAFTGVLYLSYPLWGERFLSEISLTYILLAPLTAFFVSLALALQHNRQRCGDFRISAVSEVFGKFSYVAGGGLLSVVGGAGLVATTLFSAVAKVVYIACHSKDILFGKGSRDGQQHPLKVHLHGANAMVVSHVLLTLSSAAPIFFISYRYGAEVLGQFTIVMTTIFLPSGLLGLAIGQVFYQRAAAASNDPRKVLGFWLSTLKRLTVVGLPIYLMASALSVYIYPLVLGGQWEDAGRYAQVFSLAAFFAFISTPLDRVSLVLKRSYYLPVLHTLRLLSSLITLFLALHLNMTFMGFLVLYTVQMAAIYLFDLLMGWFFLASARANIESF
ncbi:lipopolysaccharide biosynthesis protein [Pseudomonas sp. JUb96]|uniref:lipopolysaccharide biosynthesis protein n=1 Tax=Pseudomonas sp. JUb96 TaxID=2940539 RepID=UPI00222741FC|nr:oligosaccharide flippase family protein [Pseudomonas sp. JUb96]MCW2270312.1 O-antigen/teichoic acid export membrane protein [Pseudomonas sp. JUb96]